MVAIISNPGISKLRIKCILIGHIILFVGIVDIVLHFFTVALVTRGFECEEDYTVLPPVMRNYLGPILFIINLGTHSFYQFPVMYPHFYHLSARNIEISTSQNCYPGMIHLNQLDVFNFLINVIWVNFILSFVRAIHRKDPSSMQKFYILSIMKILLQMSYCVFYPYVQIDMDVPTYWTLAITDIVIAILFLWTINDHIKELHIERGEEHKIFELPPIFVPYTKEEIAVMRKEKKIFSIQSNKKKVDLSTNIAVGARA